VVSGLSFLYASSAYPSTAAARCHVYHMGLLPIPPGRSVSLSTHGQPDELMLDTSLSGRGGGLLGTRVCLVTRWHGRLVEYTPAVRSSRMQLADTRQLSARPRASPFLCQENPSTPHFQHGVRQQPLQPRILVLQRLQPLGLRDLQPTELVLVVGQNEIQTGLSPWGKVRLIDVRSGAHHAW
jgi:hypothetical protein